jgi:hypothetical protein
LKLKLKFKGLKGAATTHHEAWHVRLRRCNCCAPGGRHVDVCNPAAHAGTKCRSERKAAIRLIDSRQVFAAAKEQRESESDPPDGQWNGNCGSEGPVGKRIGTKRGQWHEKHHGALKT